MADELTDAVLVGRALADDGSAFAELVRRYRRAALARAFAVLGDQYDADDVAQESFVQAWDHLASCRDPERFGAWFLTIVKRTALNRVRTIARRRLDPIESAGTAAAVGLGAQPDADLERRELGRALHTALTRLSPVQREVVLLADLEDWSHSDIAARTGISVTMSRRHLSEARRLLRTLLASLKSN